MIANYHTHTFRCGHAEGDESEYARAAADNGFEILGFADHTPYDFFDFGPRDRPMRMKPEELEGYAESVRALAAEYSGRMEILLGVEAEYYPKYFDRLLELLRSAGVRYMILGQHFIGNEVGEAYCGRPTDDETVLDRYVSQSVVALQTGLFTYFAHPDLIRFTGPSDVYERHMRRICRAAADAAVPLEINLLGLRTGRNYPDERFWALAREEGNIAILGCDAHAPKDVWHPDVEEEALRLAEKYSLPVLRTAELQDL